MTNSTTTIKKNENTMTFAERLRTARDGLKYSRSELADRTGIPMKTIEKYEAGTSEPPISRARTLAEHLNLSLNELLDIEESSQHHSSSDPVEPMVSLVSATNEPTSHLLDPFFDLDELREVGFDTAPRHANNLIARASEVLKTLEPQMLLDLAEERELYPEDCKGIEGLLDIFATDFDEGAKYCGLIEERIIDTALFGVDLYAIERDALVNVAEKILDEHEAVERPGFLGLSWGNYDEFIPLVRSFLRNAAIAGRGESFDDEMQFPKRSLIDE